MNVDTIKEKLYESDINRIDKETLEANPPIGRINYLGFKGEVVEKVEYLNIKKLEEDFQSQRFDGVPFTITLYKDADGNCCPHKIIPDEIIDNPYLPANDSSRHKAKQENKPSKNHKRRDDMVR